MSNVDLANLRRARIRCHKEMKQTENLLAGYHAKLASLEAAIYAIAPDLKLPLQHRKANPLFPRGDFSRTMLEVLRDAPEPLPMRAIAIRMLSLRGVDMPDRALRERTYQRLSQALAVFHGKGMLVMEGTANKRVWRLAR